MPGEEDTAERGVAVVNVLIGGLVVLLAAIGGVFLYTALHADDKIKAGPSTAAAKTQAKIREAEDELEKLRERTRERSTPVPANDKSRGEYSGTSSSSPTLGTGTAGSFASLEAETGASLALAIAPFGSSPPLEFGSQEGRHAWSSIKVPILATLMKERELASEEQGWAASALTASDNEAAAALFNQLGGLAEASAAVEATLNQAAPSHPTAVATAPPPSGAVSTYGQTDWSPVASAEFFRALACGQVLAEPGREYVLGLMGSVIPEQQWGLGSVRVPGATYVGYKAGWGPEGSASGPYLVRQSGIVRGADGRGFAVTMLAQATSGSFEAGVAALDRVAGWLSEHVSSRLLRPC